jgi:hypothetical protein
MLLPPDADLRLPEYRQAVFGRFYDHALKYRLHPGMVYGWLPDIADRANDGAGATADQRAWLAWLNGNTQNPVTTALLFAAAPTHINAHAQAMDWDSDRRHQKYVFPEATRAWATDPRFGAYPGGPAQAWIAASRTWAETWAFANAQPYMGRLSTWSMIEFAKILLDRDDTYLPGGFGSGVVRIPDADTLLLRDLSGSRSHRNGLALLSGMDYRRAAYLDAAKPAWASELFMDQLEKLGASLLESARERNAGQRWAADVGYLTLESALCTYKSWHKPNRRYPGVYADMAYGRLKKAEERFGAAGAAATGPLWEARRRLLPAYLRLESSPTDPGLVPAKQNFYLTTGRVPVLGHEPQWAHMWTEFDQAVEDGSFGLRPGAARSHA